MNGGISNGRPPESGPAPGAGAADSAGNPWSGRTFDAHDDAYAEDDGIADPALLEAIAELHRGGSPADVIAAVRDARLLVPLLAHAGDIGRTVDGRSVDKTQELAIVTVAGPDGRAVLPAFTSAEALTAWNPNARPVPVDARRLALAAVSDGNELVVLDPGGPFEYLIRRPAVWAIGRDVPWTPSYEDPEVIGAIQAGLGDDPRVRSIAIAPGDPMGRSHGPEVRVELALAPGLDAGIVQSIVGDVQARWAADPVIAERVDSLGLALRSAG